MKRTNRNVMIFVSIVALLAVGIFGGIKLRNSMSSGMFSKKLTEETDVTVKTDVRVENNLIYINLDGFSYDTYDKANKDPLTETKNINQLIENGVLFTNAKTGIPSITDPMQQSIVSGAWPVDTGNCYRYYDLKKESVVQYKRDNKIENIAEAANRNNIRLLAINSWFFKENGTNEEEENLYITAPNEGASKERFEILKKVIRGEEIEAYGKRIKYEVPPQFISIYADDIDSAGHNLSEKMSENSKVDLQTRSEVEAKMAKSLLEIDKEIGEVIEILKDRGLYDKTNFVITTDHGMVPFGADTKNDTSKDWSKSQMPDVIKTISEIGKKHIGRDYRVEMVNDEGDKAKKDSEIIITTVGLQAQIKFRVEPSTEILDDIVSSVKEKPYYGKHMYDEELRVHGTLPRFADLLISPKPPYHFSNDFKRNFYAVNQHDSLDDRAQRIFTMISGPSVKNRGEYKREIHNIDMAPTMARMLGFEGPKHATASAVDDVLIDELKGPKLNIVDFKGNSKHVSSNNVKFEIETEPDVQVTINKKSAGRSDKSGKYVIEEELEEDINRFIIEVMKNEKSTRRVVFVIKNKKS